MNITTDLEWLEEGMNKSVSNYILDSLGPFLVKDGQLLTVSGWKTIGNRTMQSLNYIKGWSLLNINIVDNWHYLASYHTDGRDITIEVRSNGNSTHSIKFHIYDGKIIAQRTDVYDRLLDILPAMMTNPGFWEMVSNEEIIASESFFMDCLLLLTDQIKESKESDTSD